MSPQLLTIIVLTWYLGEFVEAERYKMCTYMYACGSAIGSVNVFVWL